MLTSPQAVAKAVETAYTLNRLLQVRRDAAVPSPDPVKGKAPPKKKATVMAMAKVMAMTSFTRKMNLQQPLLLSRKARLAQSVAVHLDKRCQIRQPLHMAAVQRRQQMNLTRPVAQSDLHHILERKDWRPKPDLQDTRSGLNFLATSDFTSTTHEQN
jgi:hypothetical protein